MNINPSFTKLGRVLAAATIVSMASLTAQAQYDPAPRQILHAGVDSSLRGQEPMGAYLFYYWNIPNFPNTNQFLRLAIAPVYVDGELAFKSLLGEHTDFAIGANGGAYAFSYQEVDNGNWRKDESFNGNGGGLSASIYHRFNPDQQIPLTGVLRAKMNYISYSDTSETGDGNTPATDFILPESQSVMTYRTGFRWGGKEPYLMPTLGMEISGWYEVDQRTAPGSYGYLVPGQYKNLEQFSQRLFGRAQLNFTTLNTNHYIVAAIQGGAAFNSDRLSCYRLGGVLPYTSEFPLLIPGYGFQELSAQDYGLLTVGYTYAFDPEKCWSLVNMGSIGVMKYQEGTGQSGSMNSGIGTGIEYSAPSKRWKIVSLFGYGIQAVRGGDRGGFSLGAAFQYNFGATQTAGDKAFEELQRSAGYK